MTRDRFEDLSAALIDSTLAVCEQALAEARLSFDELSDVLLIGGTSRLPAVQKAVRMIFRRDPHAAVHPERAVVIGAAVKAAELEGRSVHKGTWPGLSMQQVAGRTVGLALAGGVTEPVIVRSAPLPTLVRRVFSTHRDGQPEIALLVVEGESRKTGENKVIGQFRVSGLAPAPAGAVEVEVIFAMDESGTLSITARDLSTGARTTGRFELER
jgi:molecular chaperone DnaK